MKRPFSPFSLSNSSLALAATLTLMSQSTQAATYTVNTNASGVDSDSSTTTLQEAINLADANNGADTIVFDSSVTGEIAVSNTLLINEDELTVQGPGAENLKLSGQNVSTVFEVSENGSLTLNDLSITLESSSDSYSYIIDSNQSTVNGKNLIITTSEQNVLGIKSRNSDISLENTTISGMQTSEDGGAINFRSDDEGNNLSLINSTLSNNSADTGSAIYVRAGSEGGGSGFVPGVHQVNIINSTLEGNSSDEGGGAIYFRHSAEGSSESELNIINSTLSGNTSQYSGSAIYLSSDRFDPYDMTTKLNVVNSTIVNNTANESGYESSNEEDGYSGAIYAYSEDDGSESSSGGILSVNLNIKNTVLADNINGLASSSLSNDIFTQGEDISLNANNNLIEDNRDFGEIDETLLNDTNLVGVDPLLAELADNGGATMTHLPLEGSPLIDAGGSTQSYDIDGMTVTIADELLLDQRGQARIQGDEIDIGSVEYTQEPTLSSSSGSNDDGLFGGLFGSISWPIVSAGFATLFLRRRKSH